jgi:hypothetical protein
MKFNKFDTVYRDFIKEAVWVNKNNPAEEFDDQDPSLTNAQKTRLNKGIASGEFVDKSTMPAKTSAPAAPKGPGLGGRLAGAGRKLAGAVKDFADNPGGLVTGLARIGGYDARDSSRELDVVVSDPEEIKKFIDNPPEPATTGSTNTYAYKNIDIGTQNYDTLVQLLQQLNPEAADRFENGVRRLDATKQNYIQIKSTLPGVGTDSRIIVGKIGNKLYIYHPKPAAAASTP